MVIIFGKTDESTKVTGSKTICMVKGTTNGQMEESTKVSTQTIKRKATVCIITQTEGLTKASGKLANNTAKEPS